MNQNQILKTIDTFEKQFDKTVVEFKNVLKMIKQEVKNTKK